MKNEKDALQIDKFYDGLSASWDQTRPKYTSEIFAKILGKIEKPDAAILDFGCGTGLLAKYLYQRLPGAKIEGIDTSGKMVKKAQANCPECHFYTGTVSNVVLPNYDVIVAKDVFNHIQDSIETLVRLDQHLDPKGLIIIANREREAGKRSEIINALESLGLKPSTEEFAFNPSLEEIDSFLVTLSGFSEKHKESVRRHLESSGKYYIIHAQR